MQRSICTAFPTIRLIGKTNGTGSALVQINEAIHSLVKKKVVDGDSIVCRIKAHFLGHELGQVSFKAKKGLNESVAVVPGGWSKIEKQGQFHFASSRQYVCIEPKIKAFPVGIPADICIRSGIVSQFAYKFLTRKLSIDHFVHMATVRSVLPITAGTPTIFGERAVAIACFLSRYNKRGSVPGYVLDTGW